MDPKTGEEREPRDLGNGQDGQVPREPANVEELRAELALIRQEMSFTERLRSIGENDVKPLQGELARLKWAAGLLVSTLALLGFGAWNDVTGKIETVVDRKAEEAISKAEKKIAFAEDLSIGIGFTQVNPNEAIVALERALTLLRTDKEMSQKRIDLEDVLQPLLNAYDNAGRFQEGAKLLDDVHAKHLPTFRQLWTLNNAGVVYLAAGLSPETPHYLDKAAGELAQGLEMMRAPSNARERRVLHFLRMNLWITKLALCARAKDADCESAQQLVSDLVKSATTDPEGPVDGNVDKLCDEYWMPHLRWTRADMAEKAQTQLGRAGLDCLRGIPAR